MFQSNYTPHEIKLLQDFLHGFILGILKPLKSKHVIAYAEAGRVADPRRFIDSLPKDILIKVRSVIEANQYLIVKYINYEKIMNQLKKERPDLVSVLSNPKYRTWFEKYLKILQKITLNL